MENNGASENWRAKANGGRNRALLAPDPIAILNKVQSIRQMALEHFGKPEAQITAELAKRETEFTSLESAPVQPKPGNRKAPKPALEPSSSLQVLEVCDVDETLPVKPKRTPRRKQDANPETI